MGNLAQQELYKYDWRRTKFIEKYQAKAPFELINGKKVQLVVDKKIIDAVTTKKPLKDLVLIGVDKAVYKFNMLKKTDEFGGGSGSGAGAAETKAAESAQAVYCAARWSGSKTYSKKDIATAYRQADVDATLKEVEGISESWVQSSILGADRLYSEFGKKKYSFHRGSNWVKKLQAHWTKLNAKDRTFNNINKWSPADIYMISPAGMRVDVTKASSIVDLNNIMIEGMRTKDIIGVSLKKMVKTSTFSYHNFGNSNHVVKYVSSTLGRVGYFKSKDALIFFTVDGSIQFRSFPSWQGEIKGKHSAQGKVGYGAVQGILRKLKAPQLMDIRPLKDALALKNPGKDSVYYQMWTWYTKYAKDTPKLDFTDFVQECMKMNDDWRFSKYLGSNLVDTITEKHIEDDFVSQVVAYASSSSELSGPYVKIE